MNKSHFGLSLLGLRFCAILLLCAFVLSGCGAAGAGSSATAYGAGAASAAAGSDSANAGAAGNSDAASTKSTVAASTSTSSSGTGSASSNLLAGGIQQSVSVQPAGETHPVVVVFTAPSSWQFDLYQTFSANERKVAEISAISPIADASVPIDPALTASYETDEEGRYPEGYGLQETLEKQLNGNPARIYRYKTWPDDADHPWYPYYAFYAVDGYVLQMFFYSEEEGGANDALFDAVLSSVSIHTA